MSEFDFESIKNKAIEQLKAGKPLLGKDGAFAPLLESILNAALEGEMDAHLNAEERLNGNRRNGKMIVSAKWYHHSGVSGTIVSLEAVPL